MKKEVQAVPVWEMATLPDEEAARRLWETGVALLPLGAVEAHGPHLPVGTDNILAERVARLVAAELDAVVLPTLPFGQVWSLRDFPGSLSVTTETLTALLCDIGRSLRQQGVPIFALVNGHLGNLTAMKAAARTLWDEGGPRTYYFTYPGLGAVAAQVAESERFDDHFFHACEIETSMMRHLAPEQVRMDRAIKRSPQLPPDFAYRPTPWREITDIAVLGDATLATAAKGEAIIAAAVQKMVAVLRAAREESRTT